MKLELIDRFGRTTDLYIRDYLNPTLVDEMGRKVIDYQDLFPQKRRVHQKDDPSFRYIMDALVQRPSGGVSVWWMEYEGERYERALDDWRQALMVITGKWLVRASK